MTFQPDDALRIHATKAGSFDAVPAVCGSLDGEGAGDHDVPFRFGRRPWAAAPYPFSTRQYARLLGLRSRIQSDLFGAGDRQAA